MSVRLDQLEQAFEEILKAVGVSPEDELIDRQHCLVLVNLAQTGSMQTDLADKSLQTEFDRDFGALADPTNGKVSRRRLIEQLLLRMKDKGLTVF